MARQNLVFRKHAIQRMAERAIAVADVESVLETGEPIASYPHDDPYPSRLVLGWIGERPLHVVAGDDNIGGLTIIITVYEPDPALWDEGFRRKITS